MPFDTATEGGAYLDLVGRFTAKLVRLEDAPAGQYGPGTKWIFHLQDEQGQVVKEERGFNAELWQFSSNKMTPNAKARKWASALLNRTIEDGEDGALIAKQLPGKKATVVLGPNDQGRCAILRITPFGQAAAPETNGKANGQGTAKTKAGPATTPEEPPDEVLAESPAMADDDDF